MPTAPQPTHLRNFLENILPNVPPNQSPDEVLAQEIQNNPSFRLELNQLHEIESLVKTFETTRSFWWKKYLIHAIQIPFLTAFFSKNILESVTITAINLTSLKTLEWIYPIKENLFWTGLKPNLSTIQKMIYIAASYGLTSYITNSSLSFSLFCTFYAFDFLDRFSSNILAEIYMQRHRKEFITIYQDGERKIEYLPPS